MPYRPSAAHIGKHFIATVEGGITALHLRELVDIPNRLMNEPLRPKDMIRFLKAYKNMIAAMPAHILSDISLTGSELNRHLHIRDFSLAIARGTEDTHYFTANTYDMQRFDYSIGIRPLPLGIEDTSHVALAKMRRTGIEFDYDPRFLFVLGSALLMHRAFILEMAPRELAQSILLPTSNGFYLGSLKPVDFRQLVDIRRKKIARGRNKVTAVTTLKGIQSADIPDEAIMLGTTIAKTQCHYDERWIYNQVYEILSPANKSGLLKDFCFAYADGITPAGPVLDKINQTAEQLAKIINSDQWKRRVDHWASREQRWAEKRRLKP